MKEMKKYTLLTVKVISSLLCGKETTLLYCILLSATDLSDVEESLEGSKLFQIEDGKSTIQRD